MDWIKLKDRKPENGVGVIVYLRVSGFITVAYRTLIEHDNCYSWQLFGDTKYHADIEWFKQVKKEIINIK